MMLGSNCSPCCGGCPADGKPVTDPKDEGTWIPSGTWKTGVTWTFQPNPGNESGETWFFFGSAATSSKTFPATTAQQRDWGNICNWYSHSNISPALVTRSGSFSFPNIAFTKRASRLPPANAVVHSYSVISSASLPNGGLEAKNIYFWRNFAQQGSVISTTSPAHDSQGGAVFFSTPNLSTVFGGATFTQGGSNQATVNDGAEFYQDSAHFSSGVTNGGAVFWGSSFVGGTINGGAQFYGTSVLVSGTVNGGATFNESSRNFGTVNGGGVFYGNSFNGGTGTVNGGATFNDDACSEREVGGFGPPCTRKFVTHPTDLPTCNGSALNGCSTNPFVSCGCG